MKKMMMKVVVLAMVLGSTMINVIADDGTQARLDFNKTISEASSVIKLIDSKMIKVNSGTGYGMISVVITTLKIDHCKYIMTCRTDTNNATSSTLIHAHDCEYCRTGKTSTSTTTTTAKTTTTNNGNTNLFDVLFDNTSTSKTTK